MRLVQGVTAIVLITAPWSAIAQDSENLSTVMQLNHDLDSADSLIVPEQLNTSPTRILNAAQMHQLREAAPAVDVDQADGGKDFCAPGINPRYQFCDELAKRPLKAVTNRQMRLAEEDLAAGSPASIQRFSLDPTSTADQIGRGTASSQVAQSFADELLRGRKQNEESLPASVSGLPPGVLTDYGHGGPIVTEGN